MSIWNLCKTTARARWGWWISVGLLAGYGIFIGMNFASVAAGADSGGYFGSARLLTQGRLTTTLRTIPEFSGQRSSIVHTPLGFDSVDGSTVLRPTYPIGLPIHYALGALVLGWYWGPLLVGVLGTLAAVVVCYLCARELGIAPVLAASGAVALAVSPLFLFVAFIPMSDTIATAWCGAAFLAAMRARRGARWALACGAAFSVAVLVRPANLILLPALMIVLWHWRTLLWTGVGAVPGAVLNAAYNHIVYGSAFRSGYASVSELFAWKHISPSLVNYRETLPYALPLLFVGVALLPWLPWRTKTRELAACVLWALSFLLFYASYSFTAEKWWCLRFLLPAFPAFVLLGVSGVEAFTSRVAELRRRSGRIIAGILVVAVSLGCSIHLGRKEHLMLMKQYQQPYVVASEWARKNMPANALVVAMQMSPSIYFYTDLPVLRWDFVEPSDSAELAAALRKSGRPLYAILFPFECEEAQNRRLPGEWRMLAKVDVVTIWQITLRP